MTEKTSININVKYLKSLLLKYYKKFFQDENIKLSINVDHDDYIEDYVTIAITRKVKIGNYNAEKVYVLTHDEIKNVINEDLEQQGYTVNYFRYDVVDSTLLNVEVDLNKKQELKQKKL